MRKVFMMPTLEEARGDTTNAINQIVIRLSEHLPKFGYELSPVQDGADLVVGHAGQGAMGYVDVAHCHGLYPTAMFGSKKWHWEANHRVISNLRYAEEVTVPSEWVADILRRDMHLRPWVVPWATESSQWPLGVNGGYVLWNKTRVDNVCDPDPLNRLSAALPDVPFVTTFGEQRDNVRVTGRVEYDNMKALVSNAGVYLATTKETFGIGTLEAMLSGVPILGYQWGATADIVKHGSTGYLVEPGDIRGLVRGLAYCMRYRDILGTNARRTALRYTWDATASTIAAVYDQALLPHEGPEVSVVIPCHNYAQYVGEAIQSVAAQDTNFQVELIVVDDASTDDSTGVVETTFDRLQWSDARLVKLQPNVGVADARNIGVKRSSGKYVVCLDADDRFGDKSFLSTLKQALDADRSLGIVYSGLLLFNDEGSGQSEWPPEFDMSRQVQGANQVPTCCMFRREAFDRTGGYRRRFTPAEDAELWLRMASLGYGIKKVTTAPMFQYRWHDNSLSSPVRSMKAREPNWRLYHPWTRDNLRPMACLGDPTPNRHSWAVRNYDHPLVTVVIPVGPGHAKYLSSALDSVEGQTFRGWEIVVVDDTGIGEAFEECGKSHPFVTFVNTTGSKGAGYSRNVGVASANGSFVAFLDADDVFDPECLELLVDAYSKVQSGYIYGDWYSLNKQGALEVHETPEYDPMLVFQSTSLHSINILILKKDFLRAGGFDTSMPSWEDVDFFMRLATLGICGTRVSKPLTIYRYTTGSLREIGEGIKSDLKTLLRQRFGKYMEREEMCLCDTPTVVKPTTFSYYQTLTSGLEGTLADGMVRVQYVGGTAPHDLIGSATRQNYGRHENGDTLMVWAADAEVDPDSLVLLAVPEPTETPEPPAPTPLEPEVDALQTMEDEEAAEVEDEEEVPPSPPPKAPSKRSAK